ncbi:MAG: CocE/NonD family hydrolase [Actinomycetota bacterium]|nr:CocE/NonD family hydrolase [Actinomycetota bacterium]
MNVIVERNVDAKMRDGTVLRANVYRPSEEGRYPVLVQRTPYNKEFWPFVAPLLDPMRAAAEGYVVVIQDVRGRWASDGEEFYLYRNEFDDGFDTVEWAATLPYSTGDVGMYGISYMGGASWNAASTAPPSLKAISTATAPRDLYPHVWRNGAFSVGLIQSWALGGIGLSEILRKKGGSPDLWPSFLAMVDEVDAFDSNVRHMPQTSLPAAQPGDPDFLPFFFELMKHPVPDKFTDEILSKHRQADVMVPALILAGWYDPLLEDDLETFAFMRSQAATETARDKTRLIVGPWGHAAFLNYVGELDFGLRASGLSLDLTGDLTALNLRWFDQRLKGIVTGIDDEPSVKIFVMGENRWRGADSWPPAGYTDVDWYFQPEGGLSRDVVSVEGGADTFIYDPEDPCPTKGGNILMPGSFIRGPVDQTTLLSRSDVLTYISDVLIEDIEVVGDIKAHLFAATDVIDTDWVVKLCDVHPDGRMFNVADGILRASYRNGGDRQLLTPGEAQEFAVDLWASAVVFKTGHRIAVIVTSSDFPRYDRNPNTGELSVEATVTKQANQTIFHASDRPSRVTLPTFVRDLGHSDTGGRDE